MKALRVELSKLASLPSVWIAAAIGLVVPAAVTAMSSFASRDAIARGVETSARVDTGYSELAFGVLGAIILGVVAISSEYFAESEESAASRQITTSLAIVPSRLRFMLAKTTALIIAVAALAVAAITVTFAVVQLVLGEHAPGLHADDASRLVGVVVYWILTALLAFGITVLTRHGVIPLAILIANTSVVSVTYLLTRVTDMANYLPDMAGMRMFVSDLAGSTVEIAPLTAGLVMAAWVVVLLTTASLVFRGRDA